LSKKFLKFFRKDEKMGYEGRKRSCWGCACFVQDDPDYRDGKCLRHAPDRADYNFGKDIIAPNMTAPSFPNIVDSENGFCGEYIPAKITPPAIIPPVRPFEPA
jgi:hypothetical protein